MTTKFCKMHGIGNDYIYFDCLKENLVKDPFSVSIKLSDRHFGIGGDGIVLICSSEIAHAKMRMFNADGSEGKMCGNAIRCVGKYLFDRVYKGVDTLKIETLSGVKTLKMFSQNGKAHSALVDMGKAELKPENIPVLLQGDKVVNREIVVGGQKYKVTCVSMGNPHCVVFVEDPYKIDIEKIGILFEKHEIFPQNVNTEFVSVAGDNTLIMRVWERGSGETLACGTGACAAAVAATENGFFEKGNDIKVKLTGGELIINYTEQTVLMTGGCELVFEGEIEL